MIIDAIILIVAVIGFVFILYEIWDICKTEAETGLCLALADVWIAGLGLIYGIMMLLLLIVKFLLVYFGLAF